MISFTHITKVTLSIVWDNQNLPGWSYTSTPLSMCHNCHCNEIKKIKSHHTRWSIKCWTPSSVSFNDGGAIWGQRGKGHTGDLKPIHLQLILASLPVKTLQGVRERVIRGLFHFWVLGFPAAPTDLRVLHRTISLSARGPAICGSLSKPHPAMTSHHLASSWAEPHATLTRKKPWERGSVTFVGWD